MRRNSLAYPIIVLGGTVLYLVLFPPQQVDWDRAWVLLLIIPAAAYLIWSRIKYAREDAARQTDEDRNE